MDQCPICFTLLEVRDCGPCDDCGGYVPTEIEHLNEKLHTYNTYNIYEGLKLTLCGFCAVDFGSYESKYFGLKDGRQISFQDLKFEKQIDNPQIVKDKFCPDCSKRLKFLNFLSEIRDLNEKTV